MAAEVDVYGIENTLKKFMLHKCDDFAVFTGQGDKWRLKFAASGFEVFDENIRSIDTNNDATYQVRFYKKDFDEDGINNTTPYSSSFNFKVREKQNMGLSAGSSGQALSFGDMKYIAFLENRVQRLEDDLEEAEDRVADAEAALEEEDNKQKKKLGAIGQLGDALNEYPDLSNMFKAATNWLMNARGSGTGAGNNNAAPGMGNVVDITPMPPEQVEQQFKDALMKMSGYYANKYGQEKGEQLFSQDMAKLANLTDSPFKFEMAISELRKL